MSQELEIVFNGEPRKVKAQSVLELLGEFGLLEKKIAVERNQAIVPRAELESTKLVAGDKIEIVQFVGGG